MLTTSSRTLALAILLVNLGAQAAPSMRFVGQACRFKAGSNATERACETKFGEGLTLADYKCDNTGATDTSTCVQTAVNDAIAAGVNLRANAGTYKVKNITINGAVRIEGDGRTNTTFKLAVLAQFDGSPIFNISVAGVTLRHVGFDGQKASQTADGFSDSWNGGLHSTGRAYRAAVRAFSGINGTVLAGLVVEDCLFTNNYGAGLATLDVSRVKARRNKGIGNNFETIFLYSTLVGGAGTTLPNQEVISNEILNTGSGDPTTNGNAIDLNHASHSIIADNITDTSERNGLKCEFCYTTVAQGNHFNNITVDNFPCISFQGESVGSSIVGNSCTNVGSGITLGYVSPGAGFFGILIADNVIDTLTGSTQGDAIAISPVTLGGGGITVTGNQLRGVKRYCIYFAQGGISNVLVSKNNCTTTGLTTAGGFQFTVDTAGTANVKVSDNLFDLGTAATSAGGLFFNQSAGATVDNVSITGNIVHTGSGHIAFGDTGNVITRGTFSSNVSDGFGTYTSTGLVFDSVSNVLGSHNSWVAPTNGRVATTTPVNITVLDARVITNLGVAGPVAVQLPVPADPNTIPSGHVVLIKDGKGDAGVNNITITRGSATTIDGGTGTKVINTNFGSLRLVWDGNGNWWTF